MKACCCSLAGTKMCEGCPNNPINTRPIGPYLLEPCRLPGFPKEIDYDLLAKKMVDELEARKNANAKSKRSKQGGEGRCA